jgi:hypothetical protein
MRLGLLSPQARMMPARQRKPPGCEPGGWSIQLRADNRLIQKHAGIVPVVPDALEYGQPLSSRETASPSIRKSLAFIALAADAINGKRDVQSRPLRVMMRTPAASRRIIIRKPSCLISCGQPGPLGASSAADRQGSILGAANSRNSLDILGR